MKASSFIPGESTFKFAKGADIKEGLNLYAVFQQAKQWGNIPYHLHKNNCHRLAVDLFNFCLRDGSTKRILPEQVPNRILSWMASKIGVFCLGVSGASYISCGQDPSTNASIRVGAGSSLLAVDTNRKGNF